VRYKAILDADILDRYHDIDLNLAERILRVPACRFTLNRSAGEISKSLKPAG